MTKLKPCPFCGWPPEINDADTPYWWDVRCDNCDIAVGAEGDREQAIKNWNTRHQDELLIALRDVLEPYINSPLDGDLWIGSTTACHVQAIFKRLGLVRADG